jgi:uncharacterized protein
VSMFKKSTKFNQSGLTIILVPLAIFLLLISAALTYLVLDSSGLVNSESQKVVAESVSKMLTHDSPTPTPFPFSEMTIPSLRSRSYESDLGELEKLSDKPGFSSYLTSYDSDGFKVNGYLSIPDEPVPRSPGGEVGWPAVVFIHGYIPPHEYRTTENYISYVDALADDGLVVFKIDLRGHDKSEGVAHGAYYSESYVVDVLNAVSALKMADYVNPEKIGLWGHSMAGNVAFRAFAASEEITNLVIWAGAVYTYEDFSDYRISDRSYQPPPQESERTIRREELFDTYGTFDPNSDFWKQVPGTNYLDEKSGRIQLHHAVDDNVVNIGYSRNLMQVLDGTNIEHYLYEYPQGGHNLTGSSFTDAMSRSAEFLKMY